MEVATKAETYSPIAPPIQHVQQVVSSKRPSVSPKAHLPVISSKSTVRKYVLLGGVSLLVLAGAAFGYFKFRKRADSEQVNVAVSPLVSSANPNAQQSIPGQTPPLPIDSVQSPQSQATPAPVGSDSGQPSGAVAPIPITPTSIVASPKVAPTLPPARTVPTAPPAPVVPPYQQAHENAEKAFAAASYIEPPEDSALFWARKAKLEGDPVADQIEQQVLEKMKFSVQAARGARNYELATSTLEKLTLLFPDRFELQQMTVTIHQEQDEYAKQIERQRAAADFQARTKQFFLRHRHVSLGQNLDVVKAYCEGILKITPDGVARYDCNRSNDPQGRCDHIVFNSGDIKEFRLNNDGSLHLALRSGNFDFFGDPGAIQGSLEALRGLAHK